MLVHQRVPTPVFEVAAPSPGKVLGTISAESSNSNSVLNQPIATLTTG